MCCNLKKIYIKFFIITLLVSGLINPSFSMEDGEGYELFSLKRDREEIAAHEQPKKSRVIRKIKCDLDAAVLCAAPCCGEDSSDRENELGFTQELQEDPFSPKRKIMMQIVQTQVFYKKRRDDSSRALSDITPTKLNVYKVTHNLLADVV